MDVLRGGAIGDAQAVGVLAQPGEVAASAPPLDASVAELDRERARPFFEFLETEKLGAGRVGYRGARDGPVPRQSNGRSILLGLAESGATPVTAGG